MRLRRLCLCVLLFAAGLARGEQALTPPEHRRGAEQTFLTYPEWFLVHSPAEYAEFVKTRPPQTFPFVGHIRQFWQGYRCAYEATRGAYPFNIGYHVMIMVIGVSTTIEYAIKAVYETLIGRLSALAMNHGLSEEDRYGARVAQDYVDFIRVTPWYEYDFRARLVGLWRSTGLWGPDPLRKWERKYAFTTEYGIKAVYGYLIKLGTKASYEPPLLVTAVVLDRLPEGLAQDLPELKVLERYPDGRALVLVPRYQAFQRYAATLARRGASFVEIAGNRSAILVTYLSPVPWDEPAKVLFTQPILTRPGTQRVAAVVPVAALAGFLNGVQARGARLEHVYDY